MPYGAIDLPSDEPSVNGNGLVPSDIPPDTKNTTRGSTISEFGRFFNFL